MLHKNSSIIFLFFNIFEVAVCNFLNGFYIFVKTVCDVTVWYETDNVKKIKVRPPSRKIMRIFTLPPTVGSSPEPNFYDSLQKVRLRQQLEMYSLARKFEQQQQQQQQTDSVQLSME
uniref:Small integral membrane protein 19 n=1 Tax=Xiphophorus couchianus TaxID=32473 RepID=A0A3B5M2N4_9TELE